VIPRRKGRCRLASAHLQEADRAGLVVRIVQLSNLLEEAVKTGETTAEFGIEKIVPTRRYFVVGVAVLEDTRQMLMIVTRKRHAL
jgi:hypothetical protein